MLADTEGRDKYRGTSLIRNTPLLWSCGWGAISYLRGTPVTHRPLKLFIYVTLCLEMRDANANVRCDQPASAKQPRRARVGEEFTLMVLIKKSLDVRGTHTVAEAGSWVQSQPGRRHAVHDTVAARTPCAYYPDEASVLCSAWRCVMQT